MARARTKKELLDFGEKEFNRLKDVVSKVKELKKENEYIFDNRQAKDIITHVYAWQILSLDWYNVGMKGEKPDIPKKGYTFKDSPKLNEDLYQEYKHMDLDQAMKELEKTHNIFIDIIRKHTEEELETKKKYKWTGSTSIACYFASALSSHYVWAIGEINKILK